MTEDLFRYQDCWKWSENIIKQDLAYHTNVDTTSMSTTLYEDIGRELQKVAEQ